MKKSIPMNIKNLHQPKNGYWFFKDHKYIYMNPRGTQAVSLPTVDAECAPVLDNLGIPYEKTRTGRLRYWDPENSGMKEMNLPLYIKDDSTYRFTKFHTGMIFTEDSAVAANKLRDEVVNPAVREFNNQKLAIQIKELMSGHNVVGFVGDFKLPFQKEYNLVANKNTDDEIFLKVLPVEKFGGKDGERVPVKTAYAVFDVNNTQLNSKVKMRVPEKFAKLFVGTGGWQLEYWCDKLGLKSIQVVGI